MRKIETQINQIIDYLEKNGPKTKSEINEALGLKKTSATYYYAEMAERNLIAKDIPKGGKVELLKNTSQTGSGTQNTSTMTNYATLNKQDADEWLILYILSQSYRPLSQKEIREELCEWKDKNASLNSRIESLEEKGLISCTEVTPSQGNNNARFYYSTTEAVPCLSVATCEEMEGFLKISGSYGISDATTDVVERIKWIIRMDDDETNIQVPYGRRNKFKEESLKQLRRLLECPYRHKVLKIDYVSKKGAISCNLAVGSIMYSGETNEFYLFGVNPENDDYMLVRLSSIYSFEATDMDNDCFQSDRINQFVDSMFSVETGNPLNVKIRFCNKPWIKDKLESVKKIRKNANINFNYNAGKEILYTENNVRGLWALHRFVRYFGPNAIVEEPQELKDKCMETINRVNETYK